MRQPRHFQENLALLKTVSAELNQMLADGSFYRLSFANRSAWIRRVKKLYNGLRGPLDSVNLKPLLAAGAVSAAALLATDCPAPDSGGGGGPAITAFAAPVTNAFGLTDVGYDAAPSFADIDHDGDLDAFIGAQNGNIYYYQNTGIVSAPAFAARVNNPFGLVSVLDRACLCFVDIDNDGDLDAFSGKYGNTIYFQNTGTVSAPAFTAAVSNPFGLASVGNYATPCFVDIDNDGDLDAFIGSYGGNIYYFQNTGTASAPAFAAAVSNPFSLVHGTTFVRPFFTDIDNDGDLDAFIGDNNGNTYYFKNAGTLSAPVFDAPMSNPFGLVTVSTSFRTSPSFVDIDHDGDLDAFIGYNDGNTYYFRNTQY